MKKLWDKNSREIKEGRFLNAGKNSGLINSVLYRTNACTTIFDPDNFSKIDRVSALLDVTNISCEIIIEGDLVVWVIGKKEFSGVVTLDNETLVVNDEYLINVCQCYGGHVVELFEEAMEDMVIPDFIATLGCLNCTKTPVNPENNLCLECQPKETKLDLSGNHLCMTCGQRGLHNCDYIETKPTPEPTSIEHTGLSVSYYDVVIKAGEHTNPEHNQPNDVVVSCNDIIEALGMNYAQANVFKAQWRIAAAAQGKMKKGNNALYDAEKSVFFSDRVLHQQKQ